ncbi:MAG: cobalamin biosynthesis protein CbiX [Acidobacteria bacterium]|nr:cobalamin biosynthesis protein CbiX [Acidobacteriota bacterium]
MPGTMPGTVPPTIILFAHGSSVAEANEAVERVATELSARSRCPAIAAFLEKAHPDLASAIARAVGCGAFRVIIVPYFLTMGIHISKDLPELARQQQALFPGLDVKIALPMEGHPLLLEALLDRMTAAADAPEDIPENSGSTWKSAL